ncbi:hypothetical protein [Oleiagrimonas sp. C23AA]|uniref:hypothetical protein n=1 Tax=Oleiagrimonas sp. C23AA TaxID=2719047 RepID=UPI001422E31A|nr:hypothetical protein [Oleiagrimonas sp. C23AA]NII10060.1 hypothetical protein [Oleiagrimonas sp. C23AA]
MNTVPRSGLTGFFGALAAALQWRLLLWWMLLLLIPTAVVAIPLWRHLAGMLDHAVGTAGWAQHIDALAVSDALENLICQGSAPGGAGLAGMLLALLLSPWLTGMVLASARAPRVGFIELAQVGLADYGRLLRLLIWSVLPLGIAVAAFALLQHVAGGYADKAVLEGAADRVSWACTLAAWLVYVVMHTMVESARAAMLIEPGLRSATRALGRGVMLVLRRPLASLLGYLAVTAIGAVLLLLVGALRLHTGGPGFVGMLAGFAVTQMLVLVLAWMRAARLFVLAGVMHHAPSRRRRAHRLAPV